MYGLVVACARGGADRIILHTCSMGIHTADGNGASELGPVATGNFKYRAIEKNNIFHNTKHLNFTKKLFLIK
jgi:hypothetical protein